MLAQDITRQLHTVICRSCAACFQSIHCRFQRCASGANIRHVRNDLRVVVSIPPYPCMYRFQPLYWFGVCCIFPQTLRY